MCSSRNCFVVASDGAPISRSSARWFIGNSDDLAQILFARQQHDDAVDARRNAAVRRRAILEGAIHAAEFLDQHFLAIARDLERLLHDLGAVVADRAGRQLHAVADDVVLIGENVERVLRLQRLHARPAAWRRDCARNRSSCPRRSTHTSGNRRSSRTRTRPSSTDPAHCRRECAPCPRALRRRSSSPAEKNTASPAFTLAFAAMAACTFGGDEFGDRPLADERAAFFLEDDVAQPRRAFRTRPVVELVEEAARLRRRARRGNGAHASCP